MYILDEMLEDLRGEIFTIDQIVEFYSSIHILENLPLLQRYDYNISVSQTDLAREEREEGGKKKNNNITFKFFIIHVINLFNK